MIYKNDAGDSIFLIIYYNFNIYEFRLQTSNVNSVMRFRGGPSNCPIIDINNVIKTTVFFVTNFPIYQFPGGTVINTFYQLS